MLSKTVGRAEHFVGVKGKQAHLGKGKKEKSTISTVLVIRDNFW